MLPCSWVVTIQGLGKYYIPWSLYDSFSFHTTAFKAFVSYLKEITNNLTG